MQNIKANIIVLVYNTTAYLKCCLGSCINQTLHGMLSDSFEKILPDKSGFEI